MKAPKNKKIKIVTEGIMNGTYQITIRGIRDEDLHDIEVAVLDVFGRKKKKI
jgi:glycine/serine hydroxymethyltransferase